MVSEFVGTRRLVLTLLVVVAGLTGCAGTSSGDRPTLRQRWTPLEHRTVPAPDRIRSDRDMFMTALLSGAESWLAEAEHDASWARALKWSAGVLLTVGVLFTDPGTAVGASLGVGAVGYGLQRQAEDKRRCAAYLAEMATVFGTKWADKVLPEDRESWTQYQSDQSRITSRGPC